MIRSLLAVSVACVALAGCGGDSSSGAGTDPEFDAAMEKAEEVDRQNGIGADVEPKDTGKEVLPEEAFSKDDPEYLLAVIDSDDGEPSTDEVTRFAAPLDKLQRNCKSGRSDLADYAANSQQQLKKEGKDVSTYEITRQASVASEAKTPGWKCDEYFVALIAVMANE